MSPKWTNPIECSNCGRIQGTYNFTSCQCGQAYPEWVSTKAKDNPDHDRNRIDQSNRSVPLLRSADVSSGNPRVSMRLILILLTAILIITACTLPRIQSPITFDPQPTQQQSTIPTPEDLVDPNYWLQGGIAGLILLIIFVGVAKGFITIKKP